VFTVFLPLVYRVATEETSMIHCRPGLWRLPRLVFVLVVLPLALAAGPAQAQPVLLVAINSGGSDATVGKYDAVTGAAINVPLFSSPFVQSMVVDQYNHLFVAGATLSGNGTVSEYNATTGATINANFITGVLAPDRLALDGNNHLFVSEYANFDTRIVGKYDATTGATINASLITEPNPQGLYNPRGLAVDNKNHLFVSNENANTVAEYDATTGAMINATFIHQGVHDPGVLLLDGLGHLLVGDDYDTATVGMYDATTGATINAAFVPGNAGGTKALALDGSNHLFVANYSNSVGEYDATTGATINETFVTALQHMSGLAFVSSVPESSSLLLVAGAAGIAARVWRRRRAIPH
jgi:outer membrane protein assembly factor BamB